MSGQSDIAQRNRFVWWPIIAAGSLAVPFAVLEAFLHFVRLGDPDLGQLRQALSGLEFLGAMMAVFLGLPFYGLLLLGILIAREWRTALSIFLAPIGSVVTTLALLNIWVLDPYYWYVLTHQSSLLASAKQSGRDGVLLVDWRDVSTGMVGTPSTVASVLYDPSDSLADAARDPGWKALKHDVFNENLAWISSVSRLHGHFYIVWGSWG